MDARDGQYPVTVRMVDGPTQIEVVATWIAEAAGPAKTGENGVRTRRAYLSAGSGLGRYELVKNERFVLPVTVEIDNPTHIDAKIILQCASLDDHARREWPHVEIGVGGRAAVEGILTAYGRPVRAVHPHPTPARGSGRRSPG